MNKRLISLLLSGVLVFSLPGMGNFSALTVFADETDKEDDSEEKAVETISIKGLDDFIKLSEEARTQEYSKGRVFVLESDIDLTEYPNTTIPFMDGFFNGNGHTISGVVLYEDVSNYGLFRYVGENGQISNLIVDAKVNSGEDQQYVGIIAGSNSGNIIGCSAKGSIDGQAQTGAIAGVNEKTGIISGCTNESEVNGKYQTGGIAGTNQGSISGSINNGKVNANSKIQKNNMDSDSSSINISISNAVTGIAADERANETGGIAGYNEGILTDCSNKGVVGCNHLGSATGGIVGHLYGNVQNCSNEGTVYGHKMIGGIVGYFEPNEAFNYDVDYVSQLREQLDDLSDVINEVADAGEALGDDFSANTDILSDEVKALRQTLQNYGDAYDADFDAVRGRIKYQTDEIKDTVDDMDYDFKSKQLMKAINQLKEDTDKMAELIVKIRLLTPNMSNEDYELMLAILKAMEQYEQSSAEYQALLAQLQQLLISKAGSGSKSTKSKEEMVGVADEEDEEYTYIPDSDEEKVTEPDDSKKDDTNPPSDENNNEGEKPSDENPTDNGNKDENPADGGNSEGKPADGGDSDGNPSGDNNSESNPEQGGDSQSESDGGAGLDSASADVSVVTVISSIPYCAAENILEATSASASANQLQQMQQLNQLLLELAKYDEDAKKQSDLIMKYLNRMPGEFDDIKDDLEDVRYHFGNVYDATNDYLDKLSSRTDSLRYDLRIQGDNISTTIDITHDQMDADWKRFNNGLDSLTDKVHDLRMTVSDGYDELRDRIEDKSIYVDISELSEIKEGKGRILSCKNSGEIYADALAGGIAGTVDKTDSSEVALNAITDFFGSAVDDDDEEDDDENENEDKDSITKHVEAVIYDCKNTADIFSKGDYAGGVTGKANYGLIKDCQNYGDVYSEDGKYVGGIAGVSKLSITGSYMLGGLFGTSCVGGVAGKGNDISDSHVCAYMDMEEEYAKSAGAIAGKLTGSAYNNVFVDNGYGAINGVTKTDEARGISYQQMLNENELPKEYKIFTVRFIDENEVIWSNDFKYGDELNEENYPELKPYEGEYAYWEDKNVSPICRNITVHAIRRVYLPSVAAKVAGSESAKPDLLFGGDFYPDTELKVSMADTSASEQISNVKQELEPDIHYVITKSYHYELTQENPFEGEVTLRVLKDKLIPSNTILILDKDFNSLTGIIAVDSAESFLTLKTTIPSEGYVVVIEKVSTVTVLAVAVAVIVLLALLVLLLIFMRRKRKALHAKIKQALEDIDNPTQMAENNEETPDTEAVDNNKDSEEKNE